MNEPNALYDLDMDEHCSIGKTLQYNTQAAKDLLAFTRTAFVEGSGEIIEVGNTAMRYRIQSHLLLCALLILGPANWAQASGTSRPLYDVSPYDINPKSWATWRKSLSAKDWQEWCDDLNSQRWNWWRESMSPKNWRRWKETMGPADKELWRESTQMLPGILAREEQEAAAVHFKRKVLELKVGSTVIPKQQPSNKAESSQDETGTASPTNGSVPKDK